MTLDLPFNAVEVSLPGAFAAIGIVAAISFLVLMAVFIALLLALPFAGILFFVSSSTDAVLSAEKAKTSSIQTRDQLEDAAALVDASRRKVFAPRLLVLRVANGLWQQTVTRLASIATIALIDVSEPTENLVWELEDMKRHFGDRSILIGNHQKVTALIQRLEASHERGTLDHRLWFALDGCQVLAYTTDGRGMRRFARALRGQLLDLAEASSSPASTPARAAVSDSMGGL
jgi:hypothetical protein